MKNFLVETLSGTPLGTLHFALSGAGLSVLRFQALDIDEPLGRDPNLERMAGRVRGQLSEYFAGQRRTFDLPLDLSELSAFQKHVLEAVSEIPYGRTCTYTEIAARIGRPRAYRAVGRANGANPLSIVIPCHRLIGSDGSLRGYGGGLERKAWLLAHERG